MFVAGVGTGGTISGVGQLSEGAEPEREDHRRRSGRLRPFGRHAEALEGRRHRRGLRAEDVQQPVVDEWIRVSDAESFHTARELARREGMLLGGSSGTNVAAALRYARR